MRLPPYHYQYNPIEMAWGFCKTYTIINTIQLKWHGGFVRPIITSRPSCKDRVTNLWLESILKRSPEMWQHFCRHCEELISADWAKLMGNLSFENIPPFIISLGESDTRNLGILMQIMMIQNFLMGS
jgi:hypothetical protein